jgi:hypothetical protein
MKKNILRLVLFTLILTAGCISGDELKKDLGGSAREDDPRLIEKSTNGGLIDDLFDSKHQRSDHFRFKAYGFLTDNDDFLFYLSIYHLNSNRDQVKLSFDEVLTLNGTPMEYKDVSSKEKVGYSLINGQREMRWFYEVRVPKSLNYEIYFKDRKGGEIKHQFSVNEVEINLDQQILNLDDYNSNFKVEVSGIESGEFDLAYQCYFHPNKDILSTLNQDGEIAIDLNLDCNRDFKCDKIFGCNGENYALASNSKLTMDYHYSLNVGELENQITIYQITNRNLSLENSLFAGKIEFGEIDPDAYENSGRSLGIRVHRLSDNQPMFCTSFIYGLENNYSGGINQNIPLVVDERLLREEGINLEEEVVLYLASGADAKKVCYVGEDNQGSYLFDQDELNSEIIDQSEVYLLRDLIGEEITFGEFETKIDFRNTF